MKFLNSLYKIGINIFSFITMPTVSDDASACSFGTIIC